MIHYQNVIYCDYFVSFNQSLYRNHFFRCSSCSRVIAKNVVCIDNQMRCTEACKLENCANKANPVEESDMESDDDDYYDDEDSDEEEDI